MRINRGMINSEIRFAGIIKGLGMKALFSSERVLLLTRKLAKSVLMRTTSDILDFEEVFINKRSGGKVRACIYKSSQIKEKSTGVLWIHGGGYAIGAPEMDVGYAEKLITTANCVIVSPDYTLSTEKPYPAAVDDCYETLLWMKENASNLGIRDNQIFVGGVSAGGGLTVAVTLMARDEGSVNIAFQMPLYPMLDDLMDSESAKNNNAPIWNLNSNKLGWSMYLKGLSREQTIPKYAAPARETDFSHLPPAYTFVGDIEPFYNETLAYIENLQNAGVQAKVDVYEGCYHAFDIMCPKAGISKQATNKMLDEFSFAVDNHFALQDAGDDIT